MRPGRKEPGGEDSRGLQRLILVRPLRRTAPGDVMKNDHHPAHGNRGGKGSLGQGGRIRMEE